MKNTTQLNEIGNTQKGQYALGALCRRAAYRKDDETRQNAVDKSNAENAKKTNRGGAFTKMSKAFDKGYDDYRTREKSDAKKKAQQKLNEYHCDNLTLHFIETDWNGRYYYYDGDGERYVGRGGTPEHPLYLNTACGDIWEPDLDVECDNVKVLMESKKRVKRINESQLKSMIAESVKKILKEDNFERFLKDFANSTEGKEWTRQMRSPSLIAKARGQAQTLTKGGILKKDGNIDYSRKYYTPEQAEAMGYKPDEYQPSSGEYQIWHKALANSGFKTIRVKYPEPPRRRPNADSDGSEYADRNGVPMYKSLKESRLKNIVSESIKKVLRESTNDFHHTEVGENPLMKGRYGVHSIPYGDMGHFDGTLQQCKDYAPEMEKVAEERFQKDIQHAIEMGMSEEEMNKILHDTYSRRGKYIPSVNNGNVSWNEK